MRRPYPYLFYSFPNPAPHLDTLSPVSVSRGSGPIDLTVSGIGLTALTGIYLNGTRAESSFKTCGELLVAMPETLFSLAGTIEVKAENPAPQGGTSNIRHLGVNNPAPSITALQPAQADAGSAGLTLTIVGSGFFPDTVLYVNNVQRLFTFVSPTQLQTALTASDLENGGYLDINVANSQPGGGLSNTLLFLVQNPAPSLLSIDPSTITANSADTALVLTGDNFVRSSCQWSFRSVPVLVMEKCTSQGHSSGLVV